MNMSDIKFKSSRYVVSLIAGYSFILIIASPCTLIAGTLYEYYANKTETELTEETRDMGDKLKDMFDQKRILKKQQLIDFEEYYSNFKKAVFFSKKLSSYADYEKDLSFARDNEVFKGLPEESETYSADRNQGDRKTYIQKKYSRMKKNVEDEVDTYVDLVRISLDAMETLFRNDLSGFVAETDFREKMDVFLKSEAVSSYFEAEKRLKIKWPDISYRIDEQFALWMPEKTAPEAPIIDKKITGVFLK